MRFRGTTKNKLKRSVNLDFDLYDNGEVHLNGSRYRIHVEGKDLKDAKLIFAKYFDDEIEETLSKDNENASEDERKEIDWVLKNINQPIKSEKGRYYFPSTDKDTTKK